MFLKISYISVNASAYKSLNYTIDYLYNNTFANIRLILIRNHEHTLSWAGYVYVS